MDQPNSYDLVWSSPVGPLGVRTRGNALSSIDFLPLDTPPQAPTRRFTVRVASQLQAYFKDPSTPFSLPLSLDGTAFQQQVWSLLCGIPAGSVRRYGELGDKLGTSPRAIGNACRNNPCPLVVPCHRVVSAAGWGGFMGQTTGECLDIKRELLKREGARRV